MATQATARLNSTYRRRLDAIRHQVASRVDRLYASTISGADLDAEFARLFGPTATVVAAGQAQGRATASGYLSGLIALEAGRTVRLPTVGLPTPADLASRMDAWPAMVKGQLAQGVGMAEALVFGHHLVGRFADAEVTHIVDAQVEVATRQTKEFRGWEGIVSGNSCEPCQDNAGFHDKGESIYRHGGCNCDRTWVVAT
jgi:hypothetical protein